MNNHNYKVILILVLFGALLFVSCSQEKRNIQVLKDYELANKWADMALFIAKETPANSPTYASRCFGYIGLTMYETVVQTSDEYQSIGSQLNGLGSLPALKSNEKINRKISFNSGLSTIIKLLYNQTSEENKTKIDSLESAIYESLEDSSDNSVTERSIEYGQSIANTIFQWAKTDGGHRAYLKNFDKEWEHPVFEGAWQPPLFAQSFSHHPLHPHWGKNRTFLKVHESMDDPQMIKFNTSPESDYYNQFLHVYLKDKELTQEEKEMALWWGDDPDDTFTPPGHSFFIVSKTLNHFQPNLVESARAYAAVGISVADAFIKCWKWKYQFFSERPNTFIPKYIDEHWESFWPDPPFPAFPSGHAIQASAAATTLANIYGPQFLFVDDAHVNRERDDVRDVDFIAQHFESFWQVAEETALSRFYGGIHVEQDNQVGLEQGVIIGNNISNMLWDKDME